MSEKASVAVTLELKNVIERAEEVRSALEGCGRKAQAERLAELILSARKTRFAIGVVGHAKRGKSTLINGLLGRRDDIMAPVNRFPATNVVSCFCDGEKENVKVLFLDGTTVTSIEAAEIKHYACEDFNPGNRKGVKAIEVIAPFKRLAENVVLVDTPGADNALSSAHESVLLDCIPRLDAIIFLVTAQEPLTASETETLKQVRANDVKKVFFAINKIDKVGPQDLSEGIAHNREVLAEIGYGHVPIFSISAKAFQATGSDDGTEQLMFAVRELITEGRIKAIAERLSEITEHTILETKDDLAAELALCGKNAHEIHVEKAELDKLRESISKARPGMAQNFPSAWKKAISGFEAELPAIEKQMIADYNTLVESTYFIKLQSLGSTIHTDVLRRLDELLVPASERLQEEVNHAVASLELEYCGIIGIAPRQIQAITSHGDLMKGAADVLIPGVPAAFGAFVLSSLPGLVSSTIIAAGPAVAAITWNPLTWLPAIGTGAAAGATGLAGGAVAAILSPLATIGTPLLLTYAGYRVLSTWNSNMKQSKNTLALAVKDLIISLVAEVRANSGRLASRAETILCKFDNLTDSRLSVITNRLDSLSKNRPAPERIAGLNRALRLFEKLEATKLLDSNASHPTDSDRLFLV